MIKILGIVVAMVGVTLFVIGMRALIGHLKMKENDLTNRFYVGVKLLAAGVGAVFLGVVLYLTY